MTESAEKNFPAYSHLPYNWEAVGAYNAGLKKENFAQRMVYARKVWNKYQKLKRSTRNRYYY